MDSGENYQSSDTRLRCRYGYGGPQGGSANARQAEKREEERSETDKERC